MSGAFGAIETGSVDVVLAIVESMPESVPRARPVMRRARVATPAPNTMR
jgi:hypothetical protein